ncbi:recombinase-like helix-turn-helix domain-containing protein [Gordonia humi]|uniref:Recombinase-like domain-containing protein n=1 Tax=Gordonia humi TaxID=686429 RepID=A0A840ERG5_9ACTN|nr:recombinase-like helix-turn-helix domain-containing protein [Gordonia humi]MBB4134292.1 hypothetical protein [Gordonia humi]
MSLYLVQNQSRTADPTPYESKLAKAIEQVFGDGGHSLEALVDGLNEIGIHSPDGSPWSQDSLTAEMARLEQSVNGGR